MFNLYQIVLTAHGGQAIANFAGFFELTTEEAGKAVNALIPALSAAFVAKASQPGGYASLMAAMADDGYKRAYTDSAYAFSPEAQDKGGAALLNLFASEEILRHVTTQAAQFTGVSAEVQRDILPILVPILIGGTAAALQTQGPQAPGFGGIPGPFAAGFHPAAFTVGNPGAAANPFAGFTPPPAVQAGWDALAKILQKQTGVEPGGGKP